MFEDTTAPSFSVATPTLNALAALKRCVGSVRGQTNVRVEHLVQDACSADGTDRWLSRQQDLFWRSERDKGMYDAINRAWSRSRGGIVSWLNADEQYLPGTLEQVRKHFDDHPDIDFLFGDALIIGTDGSLIAARREIRLSRAYLVNGFLNAYSCTMFFRRRLLDEGMLELDTRYRYAADLELILRLMKAGKRCARLPSYLSAFTFDGNNLSTHPRMLGETLEIQNVHGRHPSQLVGRLTMLGRYAERWMTGSYRRADIDYLFAGDEIPNYRLVSGRGVGGSYRTR